MKPEDLINHQDAKFIFNNSDNLTAEGAFSRKPLRILGGERLTENKINNLLQAVTKCTAQLRESNLVLSRRDRWLEATAKVANKLLENADLDVGINAALKILGESLDCDRIDVMQHIEDDTEKYPGYVRLLYEWNSVYATPQMLHSQLYQAIWHEEWLIAAKAGKFTGGTIDELDELCRSKQLEIGVKSWYNVPIFVNNRFWGIVGIGFCRETRGLTSPEIAVFKTAASCIGSAMYRHQLQQEKEESERKRVAQLESSNLVLSLRDRWLEATANAANKLLENADLDEGINAALKMLGESLNCDRVDIMQHIQEDTGKSSSFMHLLYEWNSKATISQIEHTQLHEILDDGVEEYVKRVKAGDWVGGTIDELVEPFRSSQVELGVKALYAVPVFVNNQFWGIVGIDFCREARRLTLPEIAVLKTAASCIGSAIYRQQIQKEKEAAEKQKVAQLEESNLVLSLRDCWLEATANAANKLLENADLDAGINAALKMLGESLDCERFCVLQNFEDSTNETPGFMRIFYEWDSAQTIHPIDRPKYHKFANQGLEEWFDKIIEDKDYVGGTIDEVPEAYIEAFIGLEIQSTYNVPIFVGSQFWGILGIDFCREARRLTPPEIAVFKTAASCIGSAIYRQQIQQEKEQAELAILEERNRMAREIHDTLAQAFTGISLQLEAARNSLSTNPEVAIERLLSAKNLAKEGIDEARRSVRALRPEALEFGLVTALHQLIDKMLLGTNIEAEISIEGETHTLTSEIEVQLFRISQEALTNVIRHAQATEVWIQLIYEPDTIYLQIKDNGIGFDLKQSHNEGFGLLGIRERCDRLSSNLAINSEVGEGTEITITVANN